MNNDALKKHLFKWLFETMDKLTKKDIQLRRGTESTLVSMSFSGKGLRKSIGGRSLMTESEKLLNDGSDDSDGNQSKLKKSDK